MEIYNRFPADVTVAGPRVITAFAAEGRDAAFAVISARSGFDAKSTFTYSSDDFSPAPCALMRGQSVRRHEKLSNTTIDRGNNVSLIDNGAVLPLASLISQPGAHDAAFGLFEPVKPNYP